MIRWAALPVAKTFGQYGVPARFHHGCGAAFVLFSINACGLPQRLQR
jgi:hypothetical protein